MMRRILIFAAIVFCSTLLVAQKHEYRKHMTEGNLLLLEENYMKALQEFQKAYVYDSLNANINYKIGMCYLKHPTLKHLAENYLEVAVTDVTRKYDDDDPMMRSAPPMAYLYYGQALHLDYKFDEAIKMYETYKNYLKPKFKSELELAERMIKMSHIAHDRVGVPANVEIANLGDSVNSVHSEVAPLLSADERMLIFTYAGPLATGAADAYRTPEDGFFEDIFVCYKRADGTWTKPDTLPGYVNSNRHEGTAALSPDGQTLVLYRDDNGDGNLYFSLWNGAEWDTPSKYGGDINSTSWEPSACLSADGNAIYFVSDRPGGMGGRDIYICRKLPNGEWSKAQNLGGKVNTPFDEESPFLHPNGIDFFFSSQGHTSMGGFDVFHSTIDSTGNFSDPTALQYPVNTTDDDEFYISSADNKRAYYASSHEDRDGLGEHDIYMITLAHETEETNPLVLFKGLVYPEEGKQLPGGITITVKYKTGGELQGIYRPQQNGNFTLILRPDNAYSFSYKVDDREFYAEDLAVPGTLTYQEIEREIPLKPVKVVIPEDKTEIKGPKVFVAVKVIDLKNFLPEPGARISVTSSDGKKREFVADSTGIRDSIPFEAGKSYTLQASFREFSGESEPFKAPVAGAKKTAKTIYVSTSKETYNVDSLVNGKFIHYFEFNQTDIEHYRNYPQFLAAIDTALAQKGNITVVIKASASHVPTRFKGGLKGLAKSRAETLKIKLIEHLKSEGINPSNIKFEIQVTVGGPPFKKDFLRRIREYEKFQYVEAYIKNTVK